MKESENELGICGEHEELVDETVVDQMASWVLREALHARNTPVIVLARDELACLGNVGTCVAAPSLRLLGEVESMKPHVGYKEQP